MYFKNTASKKLCEDCQKDNWTCQQLRIWMFQSSEFYERVHSNLRRYFIQTKQSYKYYISFFVESTKLIDIEPLKYKDDALAIFSDYKALYKKQSGC